MILFQNLWIGQVARKNKQIKLIKINQTTDLLRQYSQRTTRFSVTPLTKKRTARDVGTRPFKIEGSI